MLSSAGQPSFTLGISRPTVRRFLAAEQFPERLSGPKRQRQSIVTPYLPFLRERCQESGTTLKPRRGSRVLWPIFSSSPGSGEAPPVRQETLAPPPGSLILWGDWERCQIRRSFLTLLRTQTVTVTQRAPEDRNVEETEGRTPAVLTRAQRAHWRLSWAQRRARNARGASAPALTITVHGLPSAFAQHFGCPPSASAVA